jgi:hypothetical protein
MRLYVLKIFCLKHLNVCKLECSFLFLCCSVSSTFLGEF